MFDAFLTADGLIALLTLTFLEVILGVDNVIFISILAGKLPEHQQARARRLGLAAAMITRILLLMSLAWIIRLRAPLFSLFDHPFSGRDLILLSGGLFLLAKATLEIHERLEGDEGRGQEHADRGAQHIRRGAGGVDERPWIDDHVPHSRQADLPVYIGVEEAPLTPQEQQDQRDADTGEPGDGTGSVKVAGRPDDEDAQPGQHRGAQPIGPEWHDVEEAPQQQLVRAQPCGEKGQ